MAPEILTDLQANLRRWLWDAVRARFACEVEPAAGLRSTWGHDYERHSLAGIIPATVHTRDVGADLVRLIDTVTQGLAVERPGGRLVVRGPFAADDVAAVPDGITADVRPIGEHALRVILAVVGHPITLDEARARTRAAA